MNKNKYSKLKTAALKYSKQEDMAPQGIAKGQRETAKKIIELAEEQNIPLVPSTEIVEIFLKQDFNTLIPRELSKVITEIYTLIHKLEGEFHE